MKSKKTTIVLCGIYLAVLTWIILFKMETNLSLLQRMHQRSVNLIPFAGSLVVNGSVDVAEILLNVIAFLPFGIYLSMISPEGSVSKKILSIALVSLSYEILQYIFALGASDITDLLGNTLGGILGVGIFILFSKIWKHKTIKLLNVMGLIGTATVILFLGLLTLANI